FQKKFRDGGLAQGGIRVGYQTQREGGEITLQGAETNGNGVKRHKALQQTLAATGQPGYLSQEKRAVAYRTLRVARQYETESGAELSHNLSFWWASSSLDYYTKYLDETDKVTLEQVAGYVRNYLIGRPAVVACLASKANADRFHITPDA